MVMMSGGFSQLELEKRLSQLKDTAESIQGLSAWCLKHKHQHRRIVNSWIKMIKRAKISHRLPLFYLANDVIQHSKRKNLEFVGSFQTVLETAMPLVRDEKLRPAITRILKIWEDRTIYESSFIATLTDMLSNVGKADSKETAKVLSDFRTSDLIGRVREVETSEQETDKLLKAINDGDFHVSDTAIEELRSNVKSRSQSKLFVSELEDGIKAIERYVSALDKEIQLRAELIEQLERSEIYYETQRSDAKVVAVAYKNFSRRVRELKKKLEETLPDLPDISPLPSPDINAPSPTGSDDGLELPDDADYGADAGGTDPRSEIERLLGSWTSAGPSSSAGDTNNTNSNSSSTAVAPPQQQQQQQEQRPNTASPQLPGLGGSSTSLFPGPATSLEDLFPGVASTLSAAAGSSGTPADSDSPPGPFNGGSGGPQQSFLDSGGEQLARMFDRPATASPPSTIPVVTGVKQGGTLSSQNTPQLDDDDDYEMDPSGEGLTDFIRQIGAKLQQQQQQHQQHQEESDSAAPPSTSAQYIPIPGLDLTRPPPTVPDLSVPPPGGDRQSLWTTANWEQRATRHPSSPGQTPSSPPPYEQGNSAYNAELDLPPAFKDYEEVKLPFSTDTDHRRLPPRGDSDLRQLSVSDTDHRRLPPLPVPPVISGGDDTVDGPAARHCPTSADSDLRSGQDTDHRLWDRSVEEFINQVRDRDYRRRRDDDFRPPPGDMSAPDLQDVHEEIPLSDGEEEEVRRRRRVSSGAAVVPPVTAASAPADPEVFDLDSEPEPVEVTQRGGGGAELATAGAAGPMELQLDETGSLSSLTSSSDSSLEDDPAGRRDRDGKRHSRESKKKRRRHDSTTSKKYKKDKRHSSSRKRGYSTSSRRSHERARESERDERRRKDKHHSKRKKKHSEDRERERDRGRHRSRERERGRQRDGRVRRPSEFDYSQVGAGAFRGGPGGDGGGGGGGGRHFGRRW